MLRLLRSPGLSLALMAGMAPLLALSTLLPPTHPLGVHRFTRSPLFLVPVVLHALCVLVSMADHWYRRRRRTGGPDHATHLVHLGYLVIVLGGLGSLAERVSQDFTLRQGDLVELPGGWSVSWVGFRETGRDWISTVRVERDGVLFHAAAQIGVGRPLRLGPMRLYQTGRGTEGVVRLWDGGHAEDFVLRQGELRRIGDRQLRLVALDQGMATVEEWSGNETVSTTVAGFGHFVGPFTVHELLLRPTTALTATNDPGAPVALAGAALAGAGLVWGLWRKRAGIRA